VLSGMVNLRLKVSHWAYESIFDGSLDHQFFSFTPVVGSPQRNQDFPTIALLIAIHCNSWAASIARENVAVAPGLILNGKNIVLQEDHPLAFRVDGCPATIVNKIQRDLMVFNLIGSAIPRSIPKLDNRTHKSTDEVRVQQNGQQREK